MSNPPEPLGCWVCHSQQTRLWKERGIARALQPEDLAITDQRYGTTLELHRCSDCGFIFAAADEMQELVQLYGALEDAAYESTQDTRRLQMDALLRLVGRHAKGKSLLDIGAGAGQLVSAAQALGYHAQGVEPSASLVAAAERIAGVKLVHGIFPCPELAGQRFDVILLVDVIEHLSDPVQLLQACGSALNRDGILVVVTPDVESIAARTLGRRWWHFRLAHVGYFSRRTLSLAAAKAKLAPSSWQRAKWYFPVGYLADRLQEYIPIGAINRFTKKTMPGLRSKVVPLNLHDSWVCLMKPAN